MQTVTITLGRNIGTEPMTASDWRTFHERARALLDSGEVWADATYTGTWEGVNEDAAILFGAVDDSVVGDVRDALATLAAEYSQDAIGFSVGEPGLVGPATDAEMLLSVE